MTYHIGDDGALEFLTGSNPAQLLSAAHSASIAYIPSVGSDTYNSERVHTMLVSPAIRAEHINNLVAAAVSGVYDGIDIDYEGIRLEDRNAFSTFIDELAPDAREKLTAHPRGDRSRPRKGVFGLRSPMRPNPIGVSIVTVLHIEQARLVVSGLDARHGSPVIDIKCQPKPAHAR